MRNVDLFTKSITKLTKCVNKKNNWKVIKRQKSLKRKEKCEWKEKRMVILVLTTYHLFNIICINLPKGGSKMNVRMLKAKRVERNLRQKDLANALGITEKAMCHKECSEENKFKAAEMLTLVDELNLSFSEFDSIFFNHELTKRLRRTTQKQTSGK